MGVVNIGFGNFVNTDRIVAIVNPASAPIKRLREQLEKEGKVIDATQGRKTRAIVIMDSGHVVLSGIAVNTLAERVGQ
ncbi:DUF370 domain-containing protein [Hippea maritima]|uniref:Putative regulatory protein Hipma_0466 n=1 Tax=Hippea maritima (strain ATCC 700847 / DSM 10411 / MH2) TaxID=760142 RepID=F2LUB2_HIPMA|nr:DUF370 domain-containing protein [Hippea maritima]AEA33438.1 UPF0296 protein [Hippea maritima DSM 10411]